MKKLFLIAVALFAVGCASNSGVVPIGPDTYMISKQAATGFGGLGNLKAEALKEAGVFCIKEKKTVRIVDSNESKGPYVYGNFPRAEIQFMCLEAGDVDLTRPKKLPTEVIEITNKGS